MQCRKLFIMLACFCASSVFAAAPFNGLSVGLQLGGGFTFLSKHTVTATAWGTTYNNDMMNANGLLVGLMAGYGRVFNKVYLGLNVEGDLTDVGYSYTSYNPDPATLSRKTKINQKNSYGGNIMMGYLLRPAVLLFVTGGASWASYKINDDDRYSGVHTVRNYTVPGLALGGGLMTKAYKGLYLALVYKYAAYSAIKYNYEFSGSSVQAKYEPKANYLKLELIYYLSN